MAHWRTDYRVPRRTSLSPAGAEIVFSPSTDTLLNTYFVPGIGLGNVERDPQGPGPPLSQSLQAISKDQLGIHTGVPSMSKEDVQAVGWGAIPVGYGGGASLNE